MKKKVSLIVQQMHETGVARMASNLSTHLPDNCFDKYIFTYNTSENDYLFKGEVINFNTKGNNNPFLKLFRFIKRFFLVKKLKRVKQIDVSISFQLSAGLINILTKKNDIVVVSIRNFALKDISSLNRFFYRKIIKYFYNRADLIVPVSEGIKIDLIKNFGIHEKKIEVINNFYDIDKINSLSNEPINNTELSIYGSQVIVTAGRLTDQKGHWHLIRAFKKVKHEVPTAQLVILGQGYLEVYLKKLAKKLGVYESIYFLGFQENPFKYISHAHIYAFPSLYEGFPNALCESMACGIPVISSDCATGPREILYPGLDIEQPEVKDITYADYGVLVPTCDGKMYQANDNLSKEETILANSIISLLKDRNTLEEYGRLSKKRIEDFRSDVIMQKWKSIIP